MSAQQTVSEWEADGSKFRGMTASFDLNVEPHDHFTWRWSVKDAEFGDIVATGYASDLATAQSAAAQVGQLMESDC